MAKSRQNKTKRGTSKQRAKMHDEWLKINYPEVWQNKVKSEFARVMVAKA